MTTKTLFQKAFDEMPLCVGGFDGLRHDSPADCAWLVQMQVDLWDEGEESDIKTKRQYEQCKRYLTKYEWKGSPAK